MSSGSVEAYLSWNTDLALSENGDILMATDTPSNPVATIQRTIRLLLTSPRVADPYGNWVQPPDDIFHPDYGAGLRAMVGEPFTPDFVGRVQAYVMNKLTADPQIATSPQPVVIVQVVDYQTALLNVTFNTVGGIVIPLPTLTLSVEGA